MSSHIATLSNCLGCILDSSNNPRDKIRVQPINAIWWGAFVEYRGSLSCRITMMKRKKEKMKLKSLYILGIKIETLD